MTRTQWIKSCQRWKEKWPIIQQEYLPQPEDQALNIYAVLHAINQHSTANDILMGDGGSIGYAGPTAMNAKQGQRIILNLAQGEMGWALPASIGVSMSSNQPVIATMGDGSFMLNMQELATVKQHNLNIKYVVMNNRGYLSIKNTQNKYFGGRVYGTSSETGLWFPDFANVAQAFEIGYAKVSTKKDLDNIKVLLSTLGPMIIDCTCLSEQEIMPGQALKNGHQAALHDMYPFLSDKEMQEEIINKKLLDL